jgi:hypothetical protein
MTLSPAELALWNKPRVPDAGGRILINTGASPRGVHRLELVKRCPQLFAYRHILKLDLGSRDPLVRGSLLHIGLAHHYAREKAANEGTNPDVFYEPLDAIERAAPLFGADGERLKPIALAGVKGYIAHYAVEAFTIVSVEELVVTTVGGYPLTARWDLVTQDRAGKFWIYDHKGTGSIDAKSSGRYDLSLQFLAMQWMGQEKWGANFGGVRVNLVGLIRPGFTRVSPQPAPHALALFPQAVIDAEATIERNALRDPWDWPKTLSEQACMTQYGVCEGVHPCQWGSV